jgi:hypothetical protein
MLFMLLVAGSLARGQSGFISFGSGAGRTMFRGNEIVGLYNEPRYGFLAAVHYDRPMKRFISLRTGIEFQQKALNAKGPVYNNNGEEFENARVYAHYNFLLIPLLVQLEKRGKVVWHLAAGPYAGYLLSQRNYFSAEGYYQTAEDNTENFREFELGIEAAAGIRFRARKPVSYRVEISDQLGLTNISKVPVFNDGMIKTNSTRLTLSVVYRWR